LPLKYILSDFRLTEKMNKVYGDKKKNTKRLDWNTNDLCAIFIKKYGNWYRGKIIYIDIINHKVTVSLNLQSD